MVQAFVAFYGVALPMSLLCWTGFLNAVGVIPRAGHQPWPRYLGAFTALAGGGKGESILIPAMVIWLAGLALFDFVPMGVLVLRSWGVLGVAMSLVFFGIQGFWLLSVWRVIKEAKSQDG